MATHVANPPVCPAKELFIYSDGRPGIFRPAQADILASWIMFADSDNEHWCLLYRERDEDSRFVLVYFGTHVNTFEIKSCEYLEAEVIAPTDVVVRLLTDHLPIPEDLQNEPDSCRRAGLTRGGRVELHSWRTGEERPEGWYSSTIELKRSQVHPGAYRVVVTTIRETYNAGHSSHSPDHRRDVIDGLSARQATRWLEDKGLLVPEALVPEPAESPLPTADATGLGNWPASGELHLNPTDRNILRALRDATAPPAGKVLAKAVVRSEGYTRQRCSGLSKAALIQNADGYTLTEAGRAKLAGCESAVT